MRGSKHGSSNRRRARNRTDERPYQGSQLTRGEEQHGFTLGVCVLRVWWVGGISESWSDGAPTCTQGRSVGQNYYPTKQLCRGTGRRNNLSIPCLSNWFPVQLEPRLLVVRTSRFRQFLVQRSWEKRRSPKSKFVCIQQTHFSIPSRCKRQRRRRQSIA
jgi:hypothetical protein